MNSQKWLRTGLWLVVGLMLLVGCAVETKVLQSSEVGEFFATARGRVTRINRRESWFELKAKSGGGLLTINYDATTTLLNFRDMIEIAKEQPVEVTYMPGGESPNRAVSIRKLQPDECG